MIDIFVILGIKFALKRFIPLKNVKILSCVLLEQAADRKTAWIFL